MDTHRINEMEQRLGRATAAVDAIGTPFCITIDNDTLTDNAMQQERVNINQLPGYLQAKL